MTSARTYATRKTIRRMERGREQVTTSGHIGSSLVHIPPETNDHASLNFRRHLGKECAEISI
jgi:hypothetical protein